MKTEEGVMLMNDKRKAWGIKQKNWIGVIHGWIDPDYAEIRDPQRFRTPEDFTFKDSPDIEEVRKGYIVRVTRTIITETHFLEDFPTWEVKTE